MLLKVDPFVVALLEIRSAEFPAVKAVMHSLSFGGYRRSSDDKVTIMSFVMDCRESQRKRRGRSNHPFRHRFVVTAKYCFNFMFVHGILFGCSALDRFRAVLFFSSGEHEILYKDSCLNCNVMNMAFVQISLTQNSFTGATTVQK